MARRLAAILVADIVGFCRLMQVDEAGTLLRVRQLRTSMLAPAMRRHGGRIVKEMGDGFLVEFASAVEAVACAVDIQLEAAQRNAQSSEEQRLELRIGINIGDVIAEGDDIYGDGVNVASRLEGIADPGGICIARNVRNQVRDKLKLEFLDRGEVQVKNISRPIRVFSIGLDAVGADFYSAANTGLVVPKTPRRGLVAFGIVAFSIAAGIGIWAMVVPGSERDKVSSPSNGKPSLAVMPFDNLSG